MKYVCDDVMIASTLRSLTTSKETPSDNILAMEEIIRWYKNACEQIMLACGNANFVLSSFSQRSLVNMIRNDIVIHYEKPLDKDS